MADNFVSGTVTFASDDIASVHTPRAKMTWGVDGVATDVSTSDPLPVGGTILAAVQTLLNTIAGTVYAQNAPFVDGSLGQIMLAKRRDADTTAVADGDLNTLNMDEEGRLKVASKPASYADITGNITAVQATINTPVAGGTVAGDVSRASNVMAFCTGTFAGVNVTFEGSLEATGDTNWFGIQAVRTNANTIETATGVLAAQPAYGWEMSVNALARVRVRCTALTSGTQSWRFKQGTYATEPIPAAQVSATQPVSGTVTANIGTGALAAGANLIGDVGMQVRTASAGGTLVHHAVAAATTNAAIVKASAGRLYGWSLANTTAAWVYVKLHNIATAPTAGAGVVMTIGVPPNGVAVQNIPAGVGFTTGIGRTIVTGAADADATATAVNAVVGDIVYA